jgi:hypothetical protein
LVFMSDEKPSIYDVVIPLGRSEARL